MILVIVSAQCAHLESFKGSSGSFLYSVLSNIFSRRSKEDFINNIVGVWRG